MNINFIDLSAQYEAYKSEIDVQIAEVLSTARFIGGPKLQALESDLAAFTGAKHAIGCSSGTDALLFALMALDVGPGDEVITTPFTFIATAEMIAFLGARPVFVDIDPLTCNIDAVLINDAVTERTKAIIPVGLYGQCADMDAINAVAAKYNLPVIEDAAQSFGARYNEVRSCHLSTIGCTSFFPAKPLGCYGDGGAIFTDDDALAAKMRMILNHGQSVRYKHQIIGTNGRLDAIQAAVLLVKLAHFDDEIAARERIAARYDAMLDGSDVVTPYVAHGRTSVYAQYSIQSDNREALVEKLSAANVPTAIHYPIPLHRQEAFAALGYKEGDFPVAERISRRILSLPMSPFLTQAEQDYVVDAIRG